MATNPKKSTKKKEMDQAWIETSTLVTTLGDCLMDVFDEHNIKYKHCDFYPFWNYVFNSRHNGYFANREIGILISNIRIGEGRDTIHLSYNKWNDIFTGITRLRTTIKGMTNKDIDVRKTLSNGNSSIYDLFISIK